MPMQGTSDAQQMRGRAAGRCVSRRRADVVATRNLAARYLTGSLIGTDAATAHLLRAGPPARILTARTTSELRSRLMSSPSREARDLVDLRTDQTAALDGRQRLRTVAEKLALGTATVGVFGLDPIGLEFVAAAGADG